MDNPVCQEGCSDFYVMNRSDDVDFHTLIEQSYGIGKCKLFFYSSQYNLYAEFCMLVHLYKVKRKSISVVINKRIEIYSVLILHVQHW